jgi:hypothetical protein
MFYFIFITSYTVNMPDTKIDNLKHSQVEVIGGGKVIILDTGSTINPESEAMLQALHSRSIGGLESHLKILSEKGSDNFMKNFYVGYGHKSIGDCGTASIFVEGVSMLVAKAIQDWPLYSGQEASTRYIDFQIQPFKNPMGTKEGEELLEAYRQFYIEAMEPTKTYLKSFQYTVKDDKGIEQTVQKYETVYSPPQFYKVDKITNHFYFLASGGFK